MLQNIQLRISDGELENIIIKGDGKLLVEKAEEFGNLLGQNNNLTTNQIRAIFGTVRLIEMNWDKDINGSKYKLTLLKPKMSYRAAKEGKKGKGLEALSKIFIEAINLVTTPQDSAETTRRFKRFVDFFEAILAYHKVAGGN